MLSNKKIGQTTIIVIVLMIIIFGGMAIFLLSLAKTVSQSEYINMYTNNLLSSVLKTDTGYTSPSCRTVSDLLSCSFLSPNHVCDNGQDCFSLANQKVEFYMTKFGDIKQNFRYLLIVEPEGFVSLQDGNTPYTVEIGNISLKDEKTEKIIANQRIQKMLGGNPYMINIRLIVSKNDVSA